MRDGNRTCAPPVSFTTPRDCGCLVGKTHPSQSGTSRSPARVASTASEFILTRLSSMCYLFSKLSDTDAMPSETSRRPGVTRSSVRGKSNARALFPPPTKAVCLDIAGRPRLPYPTKGPRRAADWQQGDPPSTRKIHAYPHHQRRQPDGPGRCRRVERRSPAPPS